MFLARLLLSLHYYVRMMHAHTSAMILSRAYNSTDYNKT